MALASDVSVRIFVDVMLSLENFGNNFVCFFEDDCQIDQSTCAKVGFGLKLFDWKEMNSI